MPYLLAGPFIALVGILAIFFVFRRKAVDKQSMYSARRKQIEHKVRAARQRTLAPHGHAAPQTEAPAQLDQRPAQQTVSYAAPSYAPPAPAPSWPAPPAPQQVPWDQPPAPPPAPPPPPQPMPWDQPAAAPPTPTQAPSPAPSEYDWPQAPVEPFKPTPAQPLQPAPEPTPAPSEPAWTPAPEAAEPLTPARQTAAAASSTAAGDWSVVTTAKEASVAEPASKKGKKSLATIPGSWQLASGEAPGREAEETEVKRSNQTLIAVAQYAVLVVGLVMVLIGVIVMVANSHVT